MKFRVMSRIISYLIFLGFFAVLERTSYCNSVNFELSSVQNDTITVPPIKRRLDALKVSAAIFRQSGLSDSAIVYLHTGIRLASSDKKYLTDLSEFYRLLGGLHVDHANYDEGIYYYEKSLKTAKLQGDDEIYMRNMAETGSAYMRAGERDKALECYQTTREYGYHFDNGDILARSLNSLGDLSRLKGDYDQAIAYHEEAIDVFFKKNGNRNEYWACTSLGKIYTQKNECNKAEEYFNVVLENMSKEKLYHLGAQAYLNLALCDQQLGLYDSAIADGERAFALAITLPDIDLQAHISGRLSDLYEEAGDPETALRYQKKLRELTDSIGNVAQVKRISEILFKQKENNLLQEVEKHDQLRETEKQNRLRESRQYRNIMIVAILIFILTGGYAFFIFRSLQKNKRQKKTIQEQKEDILRSIHYAKRIQSAILPPISLVQSYLPECFVLYQPKDIVAGDFYWIEKSENKILLAVADCTGHGVPGAMISVICNNALNRAVREYGLTDPGEILAKTRDIVISQFDKSEDEVHDGMDIALCAIDGHVLKFAGANNPLWLIRGEELREIEADKAPIGKFITSKPFHTHEFKLEPAMRFISFRMAMLTSSEAMPSKMVSLTMNVRENSAVRNSRPPHLNRCFCPFRTNLWPFNRKLFTGPLRTGGVNFSR